MSEFTKHDLQVTAMRGSFLWRIDQDVIYRIGDEFSEEFILVPAGTLTDFASVPRAFWTLFPPYHPRYGLAAIVHDLGCKLKGQLPARNYTWLEMANIFLEAMTVLKCGWFTRHSMYRAVRHFGPRW